MRNITKYITKHNLLLWSGITLLYFLSGKLSLYLSVENSVISLAIFFAEGISLAAVLIYGKNVWPGIFIGQMILSLSTGMDIAPALYIAAVYSSEAILAYYLFNYFQFDRELNTLFDLYLLFALIIFVLQPFSALFGNLGLVMFSVNDASMFLANLFSWWFGNMVGQVLVVPMLLVLYRERDSINYRLFRLVNLFFILFCYLIFFFSPIKNLTLLLSITIPLVILIMANTGFVYAMSSILILTLASLLSMHLGVGPFITASDSIDNLFNISFYIFAHIFVIYVHGVLLREKDIVLEELEDVNSYLEEKIKEEIEKRQEKEKLMLLRSRQAQMGEMISMIAHQWLQPLNTLSLITQNLYLKYQLNQLDDAYIEKFKNNSNRQIAQMSETIDDFRLFFKPKTEKITFDISRTIDHVKAMLLPLYEKEGIVINAEKKEGLMVNGYPNEFVQVLVNIINNARDAILQNSETVSPQIEVVVRETEEYIYVMVEDHAGGIDEEIIDKIFDPYFSTKAEKNGTGLGLYMSRIIIEDHMGGSIRAENHEDGVRFVIVLPNQSRV
jgi:signal transduction histidine kinase